MAAPEILFRDIRLPEGPVWCEAANQLLVTDVCTGVVLKLDLKSGNRAIFADTAGGPNGLTPDDRGGVWVTQNGGLDFFALAKAGYDLVPDPVPPRFITSGIQHISADGIVRAVFGEGFGFRAPNDLAVAPDGTLWFTDPPGLPWPETPCGRVWRVRPDGVPEIFAERLHYPNGIGVAADGTVVVAEQLGLMRLHADGSQDWLIEDLGAVDGFAFDIDGAIYAALPVAGEVAVITPDGKIAQRIAVPMGMPTNCCFGGDDLRTLFITAAGCHAVVAWDGAPAPGVAVLPWPAPES